MDKNSLLYYNWLHRDITAKSQKSCRGSAVYNPSGKNYDCAKTRLDRMLKEFCYPLTGQQPWKNGGN